MHQKHLISGWWQLKYVLFSPLIGEDCHFDEYFGNHQLVVFGSVFVKRSSIVCDQFT